MADKIKAIKIKQQNGTYTGEIPISVNVQNVQWDENNHTLLDALGSVDISSSGKGNLQHQIDELDGDKISTNEFNSRLNDFLREQISADTTDWLDDNVNPVGSAVIVDKTLTIEGAAADALAVKTELNKKADASNTYTKAEVNAAIDAKQIEVDDTLSITGTAADAKAVGDELTAIKADLGALPVLSDDIKRKLLACFQNVVWNDMESGEAAYQSLINALKPEARQWDFIHTKVIGGAVNGIPKLMENRPNRILLANLTGAHPVLNESDIESTLYFIPITQGAKKVTIVEHYGEEPTTDNEYPFAVGFVHYSNGAWAVDGITGVTFSGTYVDVSSYNDGAHYLWANIAKWNGNFNQQTGTPSWGNVDLTETDTSAWSFVII